MDSSLPKLVPFSPTPWARNGHSQTILGDFLPSPPLAEVGERLVIECGDGDQLICRLHHGKSNLTVLIAHGLTGNSDSGYMHRMTKIFKNQGHSVCRMNHRNCGEGLGLARWPYHSGRSDDLARVTYELRQRFPKNKILCLGFSMSGNATLLLAAGALPIKKVSSQEQFNAQSAEQGWSIPDFAISVNPPIHLENTSDRFQKRINRIYQYNFVREFRNLLRELRKRELLEETHKTSALMTIRKFDDVYTSQRSGFVSAQDYYQSCSALPYLKSIRIPTIILASQDDPIIDFSDFEKAERSTCVHLMTEKRGGHMGFVAKHKTPLGDHRWMDYALSEFVNYFNNPISRSLCIKKS